MWICIAPIVVNTPPRRSGMARVLKGSHSFTCTPRVHPLRNEPYLPLPSQPKLVLIYRPRRDGGLSWPWVAGWLHTEISVWHRELNPIRSPISVLTGSDVDRSQRANHYARPPAKMASEGQSLWVRWTCSSVDKSVNVPSAGWSMGYYRSTISSSSSSITAAINCTSTANSIAHTALDVRALSVPVSVCLSFWLSVFIRLSLAYRYVSSLRTSGVNYSLARPSLLFSDVSRLSAPLGSTLAIIRPRSVLSHTVYVHIRLSFLGQPHGCCSWRTSAPKW